MSKRRITGYVAEMHKVLVSGASNLHVSSSRGKNNFRGVKKKSRFPRKDCSYVTTQRPTAEFCPLKNEKSA